MNLSYFKAISPNDAKRLLNSFLNKESVEVTEMLESARKQGVDAKLNVANAPDVLKWLVSKAQVIPVEADESVPRWIRESDTYKQGLYEFSKSSFSIISHAAYYLGQCFVTYDTALSWEVGTGPVDAIEYNMPVVVGFRDNLQLPVLIVIDTVFHGILARGRSLERIDNVITSWLEQI